MDVVRPQFPESILIPRQGCVETFFMGDAMEMETTSITRRNVGKYAEVILNMKLCMNSIHLILANFLFAS